MSYDYFGSSQACDHLQILERYRISSDDFRTLQHLPNPIFNMRAPIASSALVRLYFKGQLVHPDDPVYGYSIVSDPSRVEASYTFSKIVFNRPVRALSPLVEVSYITRQGFCLKCSGTGRVADWTVSPTGSLATVSDTHKLSQQALKYILTSVNPFNPTLACPIRNYLGQKFGLMTTDQDISDAVTKILGTYQSIQRAQATVQRLTPNEMLADLVSVQTTKDPADPLTIYLSLVIRAYGSTDTIALNLAVQSS